jgi:hypothetical protein
VSSDLSIEFAIPSYNSGRGILPTLRSLTTATAALGLGPPALVLSDYSESTETVDAAAQWAAETGAALRVDRSERRRGLKEASNAAFDLARADVLITVDDDIVVTASALRELIAALTNEPRPQIAVGSAVPDPAYRTLRYRASAWQMRVTHRTAMMLPLDEYRGHGAFCGMSRAFYASFRYPVGSGSPSNDVEMARHLQRRSVSVRNAWQAATLKVPAGSLHDFYTQTYRAFAASGGRLPRKAWHLRAAITEAALDPAGVMAYLFARGWCGVVDRWRQEDRGIGEFFDIASSTKRI